MICETLYKLRRVAALSNSDHDLLRLQEMSPFVEVPSVLIYVGAHGPLFCSALQIKTWCDLSLSEVEQVLKEEDGKDSEEELNEKNNQFRTGRQNLHCLRAPGI